MTSCAYPMAAAERPRRTRVLERGEAGEEVVALEEEEEEARGAG